MSERVLDPLTHFPEGNPARPFPFLSILAIITMPLLGLGSRPYWIWDVTRQIESAALGNYAPDPGQFAGLAVVVGMLIAAGVGAFVGLALTWLAIRRNERWRGLRIFAWIVNGLGAALGAVLLTRAIF